jgi:hypothetical protein
VHGTDEKPGLSRIAGRLLLRLIEDVRIENIFT